MKNKKAIAGLVFVLGLVLCLTVGFFSNSKKGAKELDLSVAVPVINTYLEEEYRQFEVITVAQYDNQEKMITVCLLESGMNEVMSELVKSKDKEALKLFKEFKEKMCDISLEVRELSNTLVERNDINVTVKVLDDQNPNEYLIKVVNGEVKYSFK